MKAIKRKIIVLSGKGGKVFQSVRKIETLTFARSFSLSLSSLFSLPPSLPAGVGKSSLAVCLGMALAELSAKVRHMSEVPFPC